MLRQPLTHWFVVGFLATAVGCGGGKSDESSKEFQRNELTTAPATQHHEHQHGPHDGEVIELSDKEFHIEVVMDEGKDLIQLYVLGSDAKTAKPIDAAELVLAIKHGDKTEEFKLAPARKDGDPEGQAAMFELTSEELIEELHEHEDDGAQLSFKVGEKTITGVVKHHHH